MIKHVYSILPEICLTHMKRWWIYTTFQFWNTADGDDGIICLNWIMALLVKVR